MADVRCHSNSLVAEISDYHVWVQSNIAAMVDVGIVIYLWRHPLWVPRMRRGGFISAMGARPNENENRGPPMYVLVVRWPSGCTEGTHKGCPYTIGIGGRPQMPPV